MSGFFAHFTGRKWLSHRMAGEVMALRATGGVVALQAGMGWGKTAMCMQWVDAATQAALDSAAPILALHGWSFFSREDGFGTQPGAMTCDLLTVLRQLDTVTRRRLGLRRDVAERDRNTDPKALLQNLFNDCRDEADRRTADQPPVTLLLDAVDEANADLMQVLPTGQFPRVVLVLTGRPAAFAGGGSQPWRRWVNIVLAAPEQQEADPPDWARNLGDIGRYVEQRAVDIERHHQPVTPELRQAIIAASEGYFIVASGLLNERGNLIDDIRGWSKDPATLPRGPREYFRRQIDRALSNCLPGGESRAEAKARKNRALMLLTWLTAARETWTQADCEALLWAWHDLDDRQLWNKLWGAATAPDELATMLEQMGELFAGPGPDRELRLPHTGLRDVLKQVAQEALPHGGVRQAELAWAAICESFLADELKVEGPTCQRVERYALLFGPAHAIAAGSWRRAAHMLLDIEPEPHRSFLERLLAAGDESIRVQGWAKAKEHIAGCIAAAAAAKASDDEAVTLLRSVRHVLADQHDLVATGETPLVAALYNRQAGMWKDDCDWGSKLRAAARVLTRPWLMIVDPVAALALGTVMHRHGTEVSCIASTEDGAFVAVGFGIEAWVWSRAALAGGMTGELATRHMYDVSSVALVANAQAGGWTLASGSVDRTTRVADANEVHSAHWNSSTSGVLGHLATRHENGVTSIALVGNTQAGGWTLAAADRRIRIRHACDLHAQGPTIPAQAMPADVRAMCWLDEGRGLVVAWCSGNAALVDEFKLCNATPSMGGSAGNG